MGVSVRTFSTADEAAQALAGDRNARFFGGGTLIMRAVNEGDQSFTSILRATDPSLRDVRSQGDDVELGAAVTMREILADPALEFLHPAARAVGGPAIRNMATVGGNIFAPHPYGDFATALLALDARVKLAGGTTTPARDLAEVLRDRGQQPPPIVVSVALRRPQRETFRFRKVTRIKPKGVSLMTIAAHLPRQSGRVSNARVAYGSMGPAPMRIAAVERALEGQALDEAGIAQAVGAATSGLDVPTDPLASSWYRQQIAAVHLKRLLLER